MLKDRFMKLYISGILLVVASALLAQTPVVENVRFEQRTDGSLWVDIYYDLISPGELLLDIDIEASDDNGTSWTLPCASLTGDIGEGITQGTNKHVIWDFYTDNPDTSGYGYRLRVNANLNICGQTIIEDYTLTEDIFCTRPDNVGYACALKIGASNITLDLNGHTISGDLSNGHIEGILVENYDGIIIKNGTVENFGIEIVMSKSNNTIIENMRVQNLVSDDPINFFNGIVIGESQNVIIRDCYIELLPVMHNEEIVMANSTFTVDNCEFKGGSVGVNFAGEGPSNGIVKNSTFNGVGAGILFQYSSDGQIIDNVFLENGTGIMADPEHLSDVKGLTIEGNEIKYGGTGILFFGTIESSITNNIIKNNGHRGIILRPQMGCPDDGPYDNCFFSTGNVISDNEVIENGIDLVHLEPCIGNTWERNICESKYGDEIPECTASIYSTAREGLSSVDSAAWLIAEDAQLVQVSSLFCDTIGKALTWAYVYRSDSMQISHVFDYRSGKVIDQGSVSSTWFENNWPIPELWIDSDSAMLIADSKGGKEFKEAFEITNIEINMDRPFEETFIWSVRYFSQDTSFVTSFDASIAAPVEPPVLTITEDFTLTEDIMYTRPDNVGYACAIKIGAPNIILERCYCRRKYLLKRGSPFNNQ